MYLAALFYLFLFHEQLLQRSWRQYWVQMHFLARRLPVRCHWLHSLPWVPEFSAVCPSSVQSLELRRPASAWWVVPWWFSALKLTLSGRRSKIHFLECLK
jgi:hypothetical protein